VTDTDPLAVAAQPAGSTPASGFRRLNAADRTLLAIDRTLRRLGAPGFETQKFVWLRGRADPARLRAALARLGAEYPVTTARLVEAVERDGPCWRFRPGALAELRETDLESAAPQAVLEHAGLLLSTPRDPAEADPIRFHLLHRPDGRDVFLIQFNHTLMDHSDTTRVLRYLEGCDRAPLGIPEPHHHPGGDLIRAHLARFPRARRRAAVRRVEEWPRLLRGGAVQLGHRGWVGSGPAQLRLATRCLDQLPTQALQARVQASRGIPSLSMAVLGSVFRTLARLAPSGGKRGRYFAVGIGVDLGLARGPAPVWQNLASLVPIWAETGDLQDRDRLVCGLGRQLRERLACDIDLGVLELAAIFARRPRQARWAIELLLRYCASLWYGYFGSLDGVGDRFCGAAIEQVFSAGPCWAPMGLTLLVNQYGGRLLFQATYIPDVVPEPLVNTFLDHLLDDLTA
jgi:hypothetical protein